MMDADGQQRDDLAGRLERVEVQRAASSIPGRTIVQVLTTIPEGVGYILAGNVEMRIAGGSTLHLSAGSGFLIPPGVRHNARDVGPGTGRMLSTYLVDPDEPLATFAEPPAEGGS